MQTAEPIAWRSADGEPAPFRHSPPDSVAAQASRETRDTRQNQGFAQQTKTQEAEVLERRLSELEGARQVEIAYARQGGFEEGVRKGREEAASEVQKALDQIARAITDLAGQKRKIRKEAEHELVTLSLAVARRILHRELLADPESIQGIVYAALQKLQNREISRVRIYLAGASAVRAAMERIGIRNAVEIIADPMLPPGAILFETALGELDASVETQLQEIERGFADRLALP